MPSAEASLYTLLGRILSSEIDAGLLAVLQSEGIRETLEKIEPGSLESLCLETAATEFCRLFVLPNGVPPAAAAWFPEPNSDDAIQIGILVHNLQAELDLELPAGLPPDHAGTILAIMGWLSENQPPAAVEFRHTALAPWIGSFANALGRSTTVPFYRAVAAILTSLFPSPRDSS